MRNEWQKKSVLSFLVSSSSFRALSNMALFVTAFPCCFSKTFLKQYNLSDAIKI